jgi:hypothetical protein
MDLFCRRDAGSTLILQKRDNSNGRPTHSRTTKTNVTDLQFVRVSTPRRQDATARRKTVPSLDRKMDDRNRRTGRKIDGKKIGDQHAPFVFLPSIFLPAPAFDFAKV